MSAQAPQSRSPSLAEAVLDAIRRQLSKVLVARPGKVISFVPATGMATIRPLLANLTSEPDGSMSPAALPDLYNVPVFFMGGGGLRITTPVVAGDLALLLFCDRSIDTWKAAPHQASAPLDGRSHALGDAIALVGLQVWTTPSTTAIQIGSNTGLFQGAGLGANIRTELNAIWAAIYGGHTHSVAVTVATTGTATAQTGSGTGTAAAAIGTASTQLVASTTVVITP